MPHRTIDLLLGIPGLLLVALFWLAGRRQDLLSGVGPGRLRRFLGAGLALAAWLGWMTPAVKAEPAAPPASAGQPVAAATQDADLESASEWKDLQRIWKEAELVSSGKRGDYPFDQAGRDRQLKELESAGRLIDTLVTRGFFPAPVGSLMKIDLAELTRGVEKKRPREMQDATCYKPMWFDPAGDALGRLEKRLPLIERIAPAKVGGAVGKIVLEAIERDLAVLTEGEKTLPEKDRGRAKALLEKVRAAVSRATGTPAPSR